MQNLPLYFNIFFLKVLVITNKDDENVICVIFINKIIIYFSSWYQSFWSWEPCFCRLVNRRHYHCSPSMLRLVVKQKGVPQPLSPQIKSSGLLSNKRWCLDINKNEEDLIEEREKELIGVNIKNMAKKKKEEEIKGRFQWQGRL